MDETNIRDPILDETKDPQKSCLIISIKVFRSWSHVRYGNVESGHNFYEHCFFVCYMYTEDPQLTKSRTETYTTKIGD